MQNMLFHAHSGIRYLVLLGGLVALLYLIGQMLRGRQFDRVGRILVAIFVGLLDLQTLLGIGLLFLFTIYPALWGHVVMMLAAVAVAHIVSAINKKRPEARRSNGLALAGVVVPLALIVFGILAIGRGLV